MKRTTFISAAAFVGAVAIVLLNAGSTTSNVNGPPAGRCGDPAGGGQTCAVSGCHNSFPLQTVSGWITSNIPVNGYTPGQTYTVTATATQTGISKFGFQISPQSPTGTLLGTLIVTNTTQTQLTGAGKYIEHKSAGTTGSGGSKTWTFDWTAPPAGTGNVTFYGAFNAANGNGNASGDQIYKTTYTVSESVCTGVTILSNASVVPSTCGSNNGSIGVNPGGGTAPYSMLWNNGATPSTLSNINGSYQVTVTDANGCSGSSGWNVASIGITLALTSTNSTCSNANGSVTSTLTGGTAPFVYGWSNGASSQNIGNISAGTYSLTVVDALGCSATDAATVSNFAPPVVTLTVTNASCGSNDGMISTTISGGTAPYTYSWSNGATTQNLTNAGSGTYTFIVTDANGCTASDGATIASPSAPTVSSTAVSATCGNSNGSVSISVVGGAMPYSFVWNNGATADDLLNLSAGNYSVTVTDANNCSATSDATVGNTGAPSIVVTTGNSTCGMSNGTISVSATNGTPPYAYLWNNGPITPTQTGLQSGAYSVTVTDAVGCSAFAADSVGQDSGPNVTVIPTNSYCGNLGYVAATVNGGMLPYTYSWSNGDTSSSAAVDTGIYFVTVTDAAGCVGVDNDTVKYFPGPLLSVVTTPAYCGNANGAALLTVVTNSGVMTITWSTGDSTAMVTNLPAGTYSVTVVDLNYCSADTSVTVVSQPNNLSDTVLVQNATCGGNNGSIQLQVQGGTAPYQLSWSAGGSFNGMNLAAGTYDVTITDAIGCTLADTSVVLQLGSPVTGGIYGLDSVHVDSTYIYSVNPQPIGSTVSWSATGGHIITQNTNSVTVQWDSIGNDLLAVTVADTNGCITSDALTVFVDIGAGASFVSRIADNWSLYPNPAADRIIVQIDSKQPANCEVSLFSIEGRLIGDYTWFSFRGRTRHTITLNGMEPGTYLLKFQTGVLVDCKFFTVIR